MKVEFEQNGTICRGKVIATIVEEKDINRLQTQQFIRFVILLKDGTFTSIQIKECRKTKTFFKKALNKIFQLFPFWKQL